MAQVLDLCNDKHASLAKEMEKVITVLLNYVKVLYGFFSTSSAIYLIYKKFINYT